MTLYVTFISAIQKRKLPESIEKLRKQVSFEWEEGVLKELTASDALASAIEHNHVSYVDYLLREYKMDALHMQERCCSHLILAVKWNRHLALETILFHMTKWDSKTTINNNRGSHLKTAVHVSCELRRYECLKMLISYGANSNTRDIMGNTPLEYCLFGSNEQCHVNICNKCVQLIVNSISHIDISIKERFDKLKGERPNDNYLSVIELPPMPARLTQLCRCTIRTSLGLQGRLPYNIQLLPLPPLLLSYVSLES
uniref:Ankyrin repeat domain-containing protein 9-like n=1 Tax=Saccoglossus kowalevskii TaxID=10224 RepID=A0ABM0MCH5_SACKO|nr:PREDICTED: ankyrin repeat domain-containing protein 9-like [Saccoglossus kowalevskii]